jgi:cyclic pyranopterin phosphate synthase
MPEGGAPWRPKEEILTLEEIERLVRLFVQLGVTKVRLTGGEPTVRRGYLGLARRLAAIEGLSEVAMTTNGARLRTDAAALKEAGLAGVNVSLDSLRRERFQSITRRDELENVLAGIEKALEAGLATKVNVVVMPGVNDDEALDFVEFVEDRPVTVRFIEFMPFLDNRWRPTRVLASAELRARIAERYPLIPAPGRAQDVARECEIPGFCGRVAFVSSVTESFCARCSRIRLTADGRLKSCLFLPPEVSLRDLMRAGAGEEALARAIRRCLAGKWRAHPPMRDWKQLDQLTMVQIGG